MKEVIYILLSNIQKIVCYICMYICILLYTCTVHTTHNTLSSVKINNAKIIYISYVYDYITTFLYFLYAYTLASLHIQYVVFHICLLSIHIYIHTCITLLYSLATVFFVLIILCYLKVASMSRTCCVVILTASTWRMKASGEINNTPLNEVGRS